MRDVPDWSIQTAWWVSGIFATGAVWYFLSTNESALAVVAAVAAVLFALIAVLLHRRKDAALVTAEPVRSYEGSTTPTPRQHAPVPPIGEKGYEEARQLLMAAGWQPLIYPNGHGFSSDIGSGNGPFFWNMGYREIRSSSGTGLAHCRFSFADVYGNHLAVVTGGEVYDDSPNSVKVYRWFFFDKNDD